MLADAAAEATTNQRRATELPTNSKPSKTRNSRAQPKRQGKRRSKKSGQRRPAE